MTLHVFSKFSNWLVRPTIPRYRNFVWETEQFTECSLYRDFLHICMGNDRRQPGRLLIPGIFPISESFIYSFTVHTRHAIPGCIPVQNGDIRAGTIWRPPSVRKDTLEPDYLRVFTVICTFWSAEDTYQIHPRRVTLILPYGQLVMSDPTSAI